MCLCYCVALISITTKDCCTSKELYRFHLKQNLWSHKCVACTGQTMARNPLQTYSGSVFQSPNCMSQEVDDICI